MVSKQCSCFDKEIDIASTLLARDYKGFGNQGMNACIEVSKENWYAKCNKIREYI